MYKEQFALLDKKFYVEKINEEIEEIVKQINQNKKDAKHITRTINKYPYLSPETVKIMEQYRAKLRNKNATLLRRFRLLEQDLIDINNR